MRGLCSSYIGVLVLIEGKEYWQGFNASLYGQWILLIAMPIKVIIVIVINYFWSFVYTLSLSTFLCQSFDSFGNAVGSVYHRILITLEVTRCGAYEMQITSSMSCTYTTLTGVFMHCYIVGWNNSLSIFNLPIHLMREKCIKFAFRNRIMFRISKIAKVSLLGFIEAVFALEYFQLIIS